LADDADEVDPLAEDVVALGVVGAVRLGGLDEAGTAASPGAAAPAGTAASPRIAGAVASAGTARGASTENSGCGLACGAAAFILECFFPFTGAGGGGLGTPSADASVAECIGADSF